MPSFLARSRRSRKTQRLKSCGFWRAHNFAVEPLEDRRLLTLLGIDTTQPPAAFLIDYPRITYNNTGITNYDFDTQKLDITGDALTFRLTSASPLRPIVNKPVPSVEIHILVDSTGALVGGVPGNDLVISGDVDVNGDSVIDYSGPLLTGEIVQFGFQEQGVSSDQFDFRFRPTGGSLLPLYVGKDIGIVQTLEAKVGLPPFTGSFSVDFTTGAKGTEGPIEQLQQDIALKKYVSTEDGDFDNGDCDTGPFVQEGDPVTFKYVITNNGDVSYKKADVHLIDDNGTPGVLGDDFDVLLNPNAVLTEGINSNNGILDIGEVWTVTLVRVPNPNTGIDPYTNTAQVVGAVPFADANGKVVLNLPPTNSNVDDANVCILEPTIELTKSVTSECIENIDGTGLVNVFTYNPLGTQVLFHYVLTNPAGPLAARMAVTLFDDNGTPNNALDDFDVIAKVQSLIPGNPAASFLKTGGNGDDVLDPGETWTIDLPLTITQTGKYTNTATVVGKAIDINDDLVPHIDSATAESSYSIFFAAASVSIEKRVNGKDADNAPFDQVSPGTAVSYTYFVTNTGNVDLDINTLHSNVVFFDDNSTPGNTGDDFTPTSVNILGFNIGDTNKNGILDAANSANGFVGESWLFEKLNVVLNSVKDYTNTAYITLPAVDGNGEQIDADCILFASAHESATISVIATTTLPTALLGYVYEDCNNNGVFEPGEAGIVGATVELYRPGDVVPFRITQSIIGGLYQFGDLPAGIYKIHEVQPNGFFDGKEGVLLTPGSPTANFVAETLNDVIDNFTDINLPAGVVGAFYNFGELEPSSLCGYVYVDVNNNGNKDPGEMPIGGVKIRLTGYDDRGNYVDKTINTNDQDGHYDFGGLRPSGDGGYKIRETQPVLYVDGIDTIGPTTVGQTGNDVFYCISLLGCTDACDNNFGEFSLVLPSKRPFIFSNGEWHNPSNALDVNSDGEVNLADVMVVVNAFKYLGLGYLPNHNDLGQCIDVDNDQELTPADIMAIVNQLRSNTHAQQSGSNNHSNGALVDVAFSQMDNEENHAFASASVEPSAVVTTTTTVSTTTSSSQSNAVSVGLDLSTTTKKDKSTGSSGSLRGFITTKLS